MINLTTENKNTLYVVFDTRKGNVILETEDEIKAKSVTDRTQNAEYSKYPPYTYARYKKDLADLYDTTLLEY